MQKTQVFANSELEIVAEKRPKKEPAIAYCMLLLMCVCVRHRDTALQMKVFLKVELFYV